jgi:predicted SAM-dependent methyltransferase
MKSSRQKTYDWSKSKRKSNLKRILKENNLGIKLDVGCGANKQAGFAGLDQRELPGVDIVHNAEIVPYPLPDGCCSTILCSHLLEHICPKNLINVINEFWRLMKVGGQLWISMPYGTSHGFHQDPTHCGSRNETTWEYFNPYHPLYKVYEPKPWKITRNAFYQNGNMEVIMEKMAEDEIK